jgi:hypothetical protein
MEFENSGRNSTGICNLDMEGMEWFSSSILLCLWNLSNQHQICSKFDDRVLNFLPAAAQKVVWTDRDGDSGAGLTLTLHHHSLDSYGGHGMVEQQHLTLPVESLQSASVLP